MSVTALDISKAADAAWDELGKASNAIECEAYEAAAEHADNAARKLRALNGLMVTARVEAGQTAHETAHGGPHAQ